MNVVRNPHNNRSQLLSSYTSKWEIHNVAVDHLYSDCLDMRCFDTWHCGSAERDCPVVASTQCASISPLRQAIIVS